MSNNKAIIHTNSAPDAIGPYSQAVKINNTVYISGQIPLVPETMEMLEGSIEEQTARVFESLKAIAEAAGGSLNDAVKLNISLIDLENFAAVNSVMSQYLSEPFPARACVGVASLPKNAQVEIEAILAV